MRLVIQRVSQASVAVGADLIAEIGPGLLVLVGVTHDDNRAVAVALARKVARLRILRDGHRDESAATDLAAPVLVVSQFTLYGDIGSGRRPSWSAAAPRASAEPLIDSFVDELRRGGLHVETGQFGAMMSVASINDGPMTILLESSPTAPLD